MRLDSLLAAADLGAAGVPVLESRGDPSTADISAIVLDSRAVRPGALYCCVTGQRVDGHQFAPEAVAAVSDLARRQGVTPFMALLGVFQALLARWTGEAVIPVGTAVANRRRPEVERLIGLFVNSVVLAVPVGDDPAFGDFLARVRQACLGAYAHQDLPFERLVEELRPSRDLGQNPLFQVMLVF